MNKTLKSIRIEMQQVDACDPDKQNRGKWVMDVTAKFKENGVPPHSASVCCADFGGMFYALPLTVEGLLVLTPKK